MLNVSQAVKDAYANPSSGKTLVVYFPDLDITVDPDTIYSESFKLTEALMDMDSIEFVGCNPSKMEVQIQDFGYDVKGQKIEVSVYTEDTENEPVKLFTGIVDAVTQQSNKRIKEIVAYDELYTKGNVDIADWYKDKFENEWSDGVTLKIFRDSLFTKLNIDVVATNLVNDVLQFTKQYSPVNLKALDVIKYICQINGRFGIINREGKFEYRQLNSSAVNVEVYKEIDYQEFRVKPVDKLTIRQTDTEEGVSVGSGTNNYIVQGNFFTFNLEESDITPLAQNLYPEISNVSYVPVRVSQLAYPWIEVGDSVTYQVYDFEASQSQGEDIYTSMTFYIFERYLTGIQAFRDEYEAQGEEEQSVFITNINAQIQTIRDQIENIQGKIQSLDLKYVMFYNEDDVDVTDGQSGVIASVDFAVSKACQVHFELEYLLECETTETIANNIITNNDLNITLLYEFDGQIIDSRESQETYQDGRHVLSAYYVFNIRDTVGHTLKIWLTCGGGSVHIDAFKAQHTLLGLGTLVGNIWDGSIRVNETVLPISIAEIMTLANATDDVTITLIPPIRISASDNVQSPVISDGVQIANITEEVSVDTEQE